MIVFIRGTADGGTVRGYLPLCQGSKGVWKPLGESLLGSAEEAMQVCVDGLRADVLALQGDMVRCRGQRLGEFLGNIRRVVWAGSTATCPVCSIVRGVTNTWSFAAGNA